MPGVGSTVENPRLYLLNVSDGLRQWPTRYGMLRTATDRVVITVGVTQLNRIGSKPFVEPGTQIIAVLPYCRIAVLP
jgi:hypothetical protein